MAMTRTISIHRWKSGVIWTR